MDSSFIIMQIISGLTVATLLFLVASGLSLIFGVGDVFNFAHGSFYMVGAYLAFQIISVLQVNFWLGLILSGLGAGLVGIVAEVFLLRRIYGRKHEAGFQILLTYCLILIIDDLVKIIWGTEYKTIQRPPGLSGAVQIGDLYIPSYNLAIIAIGIVVVVAAWWVLAKTRSGRIARAAAVDREMLSAMGINVPLTMTMVFGIATALGGFAGALAAPLRSVTPGAGIEVIIDSLIVVVIGGMGNFWGAWLGAILIGEITAFGIVFAPQWATLFSYLVMIIVLIFKPEGLFAPRNIRKV